MMNDKGTYPVLGNTSDEPAYRCIVSIHDQPTGHKIAEYAQVDVLPPNHRESLDWPERARPSTGLTSSRSISPLLSLIETACAGRVGGMASYVSRKHLINRELGTTAGHAARHEDERL